MKLKLLSASVRQSFDRGGRILPQSTNFAFGIDAVTQHTVSCWVRAPGGSTRR